MTIRSFRARFQGPWKIVEVEGSIQIWAGPYCLLYTYPHRSMAGRGHYWAPQANLGRGPGVGAGYSEAGERHNERDDKQRVRGVDVLREMGFSWRNERWLRPLNAENQPAIIPAADAMHRVLVERADRLVGCVENSDDEEELVRIGEAVEVCEALRGPRGKEPGGKG